MAGMSHLSNSLSPTATQIAAVLQDIFGFHSFRPNQEEIVQAILARQDCLVIVPAAARESACLRSTCAIGSSTRGQGGARRPTRLAVQTILPSSRNRSTCDFNLLGTTAKDGPYWLTALNRMYSPGNLAIRNKP